MWMRGIFAAVLGAALILAPALAEARAGGGKSWGSRGSQTFQRTPAKPIERSVTQPGQTPGVQPGGGAAVGSAARPGAQPGMQPGMAAAGRGGMFGSPFMTGLMGGFLGAGLAGMIFGNSAHAAGAEGSATGGMIGMLLQFAMLGGFAYLGLMLFRRFTGASRPAEAAAGADGNARAMPFGAAGDAAPTVDAGPEVTDEDRRSFGEALLKIQAAWSEGDLATLKRLATPEMVSYFAEDRTDAESRGERNVVDRLELLKGDVVDNWVEGNRQYATAVMTWSAIDYVERDGEVVSGDPRNPTV